MASLTSRALSAGRNAAARPARRRVAVRAFKVTLKTPSGEQTIACSGDTYILDAAEVDPARLLDSLFPHSSARAGAADGP
jgi:hypothetical protein